jgi:hypothetical protein
MGDAPGYEEYNAAIQRDNDVRQIARELQGAIEQAAEKWSALGLTPDDVGQWIESAVECSDWIDFCNEEVAATQEP